MKRKLMLYDEPTSGQDGENLLRTAELIRAANKQAASTLIVTHDPELILRCATHILHIHAGEVKKFIPLDERGVIYMKKVFGEDAQTKKPQKTGIPRLLEFTGRHRPLLGAAQLLSGISALFLLGPFVCVYFAARAILTGLAGGGFVISSLVQWGVWALALELAGLIINFAALMCSHTAAFHTEKNLKMAALRHLSRMPMGYFEENPSGKLRKIIERSGHDGCQPCADAGYGLAHWPSTDRSDACKLCLPDDNDGRKNHEFHEALSGRSGGNEPRGGGVCPGNLRD